MSWFHCYEHRPGAALRLFCFPHAGGSAAFYRAWHHDLPAAVEVRAVQYPGRGDRRADPPVRDARRLAAAVADAMAPLLDRPVALFGHSLGALVAYEVARELEARGRGVLHLFASGRHAPHERRHGDAHTWSDDALAAELVRLGGVEPEFMADPVMRELTLPVVRHDYRIDATYHHLSDGVLACPVTVLLGDADPEVTPEQAARWAELTRGQCAVRVLRGDHFYLVPRRSDVAAYLLAAAGAAWPSTP
ncbi:thioesterase [Sphaerisporangium melleum]|uniref:Thioesterase n=1 Tax=Sphaerisporangium melleum TaxID=321316 RepID=A0A917RKY6_9ACTN|nr:alpha/beta fold hydrolase [Sphaerisporangium melleum]GGL11865.1 thioesterase [Sphaerisporangium melleum]GII74356.1 thioesterase [Sphaerisporangium melleum]